MATVTVSTASGHVNVSQALYTTTTNQFGKVVFGSGGTMVPVNFSVVDISVGSDITILGGLTLATGVTYSLTATVNVSNVNYTADNPPRVQWTTLAGVEIGPAMPITKPVTILYTTSGPSPTVVVAQIVAPEGTTWEYPAKIVDSTVVAQAVSGYTV